MNWIKLPWQKLCHHVVSNPAKKIFFQTDALPVSWGLVLFALLVGCSSFHSLFHSVNRLVDNRVSQLIGVAWSFGFRRGACRLQATEETLILPLVTTG